MAREREKAKRRKTASMLYQAKQARQANRTQDKGTQHISTQDTGHTSTQDQEHTTSHKRGRGGYILQIYITREHENSCGPHRGGSTLMMVHMNHDSRVKCEINSNRTLCGRRACCLSNRGRGESAGGGVVRGERRHVTTVGGWWVI